VCDQVLPIDTKKQPILILARKNSGLKVLTEAFGNRHGVFVHVDPLDEIADRREDPRIVETLLYKLGQLGRCDAGRENFDAFKKSNRKTVSQNDFVRHACRRDGDGDGVCVTSDVLLSRLCEKFPSRVVTSSSLPMRTARQLMIANPSLTVLYLFRDPRAVVNTRWNRYKTSFSSLAMPRPNKLACSNAAIVFSVPALGIVKVLK
jgi:hypothetical protein